MARKYYKSVVTGKVWLDYEIDKAAEIFGLERSGVMSHFTEVKPNVIEFIKSGSIVRSCAAYQDIHGCTFAEAKEKVDLMMSDFEHYRKG